MTIHTYYERICRGQEWMINTWESSWRKRGWQTRILTERDAIKHPRHDKVIQHVASIHTGPNPLVYEMACYRRWLALAVVGGGFMSDYDVFNFSLKPLAPRPRDFEILTGGNVCPAFVWATPKGLSWFFDRLFEFRCGDARDGNHSDQSFCDYLQQVRGFDTGREVLCWQNNDTQPDRQSAVVHFPHGACPQGREIALKQYSRSL